MFGDERFKRYGCSEPGMFSDLVFREACQCDPKQDIISGTERLYNKTLKKLGRNVYGSGDTIVTKTSQFFQGLTLGAEGGGACTRYFTVHVCTTNESLIKCFLNTFWEDTARHSK